MDILRINRVVIRQHFRLKRDIEICNIRVNIYKNVNLAADLTLSLYLDDTLIATSDTISAQDLNLEMTEDYAYGMVRFDFEGFVNLHVREGEPETEYEWRLESNGGTDTNYLAAVRQWEHPTIRIYYADQVEQLEGPNDAVEPYGFEIYTNKI